MTHPTSVSDSTDDAPHHDNRRRFFHRKKASCPFRRTAMARHMIRRINHAYNDLWHKNILGGHDVWLDDTGSRDEMLKRAWQLEEAGVEIIGVCYYDDFDSDHLDRTGSLYLGWCPYEPDSPMAIQLGSTIQAALEARGLKTRWDGTEEQKIEVYAMKGPRCDYWLPYRPIS